VQVLDFETLEREVLERFERRIKKETGPLESLQDFIPRITPKFTSPTHLKPATDLLEKCLTEGGQRIILNVGPRHSKTESLLHFIALALKRHPEKSIAYSSYGQVFSDSKALKAQRYAEAAGVRPDEKLANRREWRTVQGGGLLATSIGGPLTGHGVDLLIIDDPVRDRVQAESKAWQEACWGWFEDVAETRLEPNASVILLMTRWHENDLAGQIIKNRPEYTIVRIPTLADGLDALGKHAMPDPLGREIGEALWPARFPRETLEELQRKKPFTFAAMYQGLPRPRDGGVFGEPTFYRELPSNYARGLGIDLAYTKKTSANYTAVAEIWMDEQGIAYVKQCWRWQEQIGVTKQRARVIQAARAGQAFRVENNGPQIGVNDALELESAKGARDGLKLDRFMPVGDKLARGLDFIEAYNAGLVLFPDPEAFPECAEWLEWTLETLTDFTGVNDAEDDIYDALVNAFTGLKAPPAYKPPVVHSRITRR
jgi:predicted phage terminase large subunit-like protein